MNGLKKKFILSPTYCLHNGAVVLEQNDEIVKIGLVNSTDEELKLRLTHAVEGQLRVCKKDSDSKNDDFRSEQKTSAEFVSLTKEEFTRKVTTLFSSEKKHDERITTSCKKQDTNEEIAVESISAEENETAALLDSLIESARNLGATDIHIEENNVRFRVGGLLKREFYLDYKRAESLVRRIKLLSKLNVVEKRRGQDGQFIYLDSDDDSVFVRVSCVPAVSSCGKDEIGSVVMRILDTKRTPLELIKLGFTSNQIVVMKQFCSLPDGLILVCGPTGSGKSTTAGAMLETIRSIKNDSRKIVSLEDPPEYVLPGVTQIEIRSGSDMDFPEALRRTYRQDPDVIMIGEIRDELTAKTAVQAAMTGHLVIATMHVGTISQAVLRLYDLGQDPALVRAVLHGIIVQHLDEGKMEASIKVLDDQVEAEDEDVSVRRKYPVQRKEIGERNVVGEHTVRR